MTGDAGAPLDDEAAPSAMRPDAVARWLHLTRVVLPGLAATHRWPIRHDHCFMRVCLDLAIGAPWHQQVRRPAIRHLDDAQLARAIALAERIAAEPASLAALNRESLALRGKQRPFRVSGEASKVEALPQTPPKAGLWNPILK